MQWGAYVVIALLLVATDARADEGDARALFDEGRQLLAAGKVDEACKKLEASFALDAGAGTKFNLALCYERAGRIASAWAAYNETASMTQTRGENDRAEVARNRAVVLVPRLSWLAIVVPDASRVDGLEIARDGVHVPSSGWGANVPVDIGPHEIAASAPASEPWTTSVNVAREGEIVQVAVPLLARSATPPPSMQTTHGSDAPPIEPRTLAEQPARKQSTLPKRAGQGMVGLGAIAIGAGAFFGVRSLSRWSDSSASCSGDVCRDPGFTLRNDAIRDGDLATGMFATGIVLAGAGLALWLVAGGRE